MRSRIVNTLAIGVALCGLAACSSGDSRSDRQIGPHRAAFVGYEWVLVTIRSPQLASSAVSPDPRDPPEMQFTTDGRFGASDGVNYLTGRYVLTASGYRPVAGTSTAVGEPPLHGLGLAIHDGMGLLAARPKAVAVTVRSGTRPHTVIMTAGGYTLTFRQDGRVTSERPPSSTVTA